MEFSPFETDLDADERDQTRKNIAALDARPDPGDRIRFAVVGDSHQYVDVLASIVDRINERTDIDFFVHLGDMTDVGLREEYLATLHALKRLHVPFVTLIGNHDAISNGKKLYHAMFGPYDYSFHRGNFRFVCFNSNTLEFGSVPDPAWLEAATEKTSAFDRVIALTHQPSRVPDYASILRRTGTSLLVTAHRHAQTIRRDGELLTIAVDDALSAHWAVVDVSMDGVTVETCTRGACAIRSL